MCVYNLKKLHSFNKLVLSNKTSYHTTFINDNLTVKKILQNLVMKKGKIVIQNLVLS